MTYPVLKLTLPHTAIEATVGVLARFHYTSLWEEGVGDRTILHVCFAATITPAALRECCARCVATNPRDISGVIEMVPPYDWSNQWKEFFRPIEIAPGIVVTAEGNDVPLPAALRTIVIQPGMAFGTGQHPTTQLVARGIAADFSRHRWAHLLDIGTGSGILAMVAIASGVAHVDAVDNDPEAVRVAKENVATNAMTNAISVYDRLEPCPGPYPAIAANILLEPLSQMAPTIAARLIPGGVCYLSGILQAQVAQLTAVYVTAGLSLVRTVREGEWAMVQMRRHGS